MNLFVHKTKKNLTFQVSRLSFEPRKKNFENSSNSQNTSKLASSPQKNKQSRITILMMSLVGDEQAMQVYETDALAKSSSLIFICSVFYQFLPWNMHNRLCSGNFKLITQFYEANSLVTPTTSRTSL